MPKSLIYWLLMVGGIGFGAITQVEVTWDFANYHYFNAFAFLNGEEDYLAPAFVNSFFNPLPDIPLYFLIEHFNNYPAFIHAVQSIWFGLLLCVIYKLINLISHTKDVFRDLIILLLFTFSQPLLEQIGSSTNEIPITFLTMCAFYTLVKMIKTPTSQTLLRFLGCGLLMGMALGLKPTCVVICVSCGLGLFINYKYLQKPCKQIFIFALGGLVGYLLIDGYFMYQKWTLYANPFFPFLNAIFQSEYMDNINYRDNYYLPELSKIWQYPFRYFYRYRGLCEDYLFDYNFVVYYILMLLLPIIAIFQKKVGHIYREQRVIFFCYTIWVLFYFIWIFLFSILRYIIFFEIMGAIFFVLALKYLFTQKRYFYSLATLLILLSVVVNFINFFKNAESMPRDSSYIEFEELHLPENSLVKIYGVPTAFVIPELAKYNKFKSVTYYQFEDNGKGSTVAESGKFKELRNDIVSKHTGDTFVIYEETRFLPINIYKNYQYKIDMLIKAKKLGTRSPFIQTPLPIEDLTPDKFYCRKLINNIIKDLYFCAPITMKDLYFREDNHEDDIEK